MESSKSGSRKITITKALADTVHTVHTVQELENQGVNDGRQEDGMDDIGAPGDDTIQNVDQLQLVAQQGDEATADSLDANPTRRAEEALRHIEVA